MSVLGGSTDVTQTLLDHCVRHSTHRFGETLYIPDANGCTAMFLAAKHETVVSSSTIASLHSSFSPEVVNLLENNNASMDTSSVASTNRH